MVHLDPSVRLLAEGSEEFIGQLPLGTSGLSIDDEIVYGPSGGPSVTYKIEKIRYVVEYDVVPNAQAPDSYSSYGRTDLIVSVVE
jgi:hypothetical protein